MNNEKTNLEKTADLRLKAEQKLNSTKAKATELQIENEADVKKLIHELEVHQIELEMQNDELRKTQLQLEETSQKYFDLFDLAPVGYLKLDEKGTIQELNLMAATLLGEYRESLINKSLNSFITRKDRDIFYLHLQESQKTKRKQSCEVRFQKKGGTEFYGYMECQPIYNEDDELLYYNTAIIDISERKLAEEAMLRSEEKYKTLFEAANDAIFVADPVSGNILDVNKKALELTGYSRDELIGQHQSFIHPQDGTGKYTKTFNEVIKPGVSSLNEADVLCKNGSTVPVEISTGGKTFIAGRAVHFGVFRDISKRKKAESRMLLTSDILGLLNNQTDASVLIYEILQLVKNSTGIEAVGIRLQENEDYPYYQTTGFPREFVEAERFLCSKDEEGDTIRDESGNLLLECMCGNIIRGRVDPTLPFFTRGGSFWTNSTTELLANTSEKERQSHTRNRCNGEGYESVALIPLRSEEGIIGLLQLNDHRKNLFSLQMIGFFEELGNSIGIALKRIHMERTLQERESHLASIIKNPAGYMIYRLKAGPDPMSPVVTHVSPSITEILGIKPEDSRNYPIWFQNVYPEDLPRLIASNQKGMKPPFIFEEEFRYNHPVKGMVWLQARTNGIPYRDDPDNIEWAHGILIDITERKQAEKDLHAAKAFLDSVINTIADPVFVKDDKRNFMIVNDALCTIVGRSQEELLGKDGDDMFPEDQVAVFRKIDLEVLETGKESLIEEFLSNLTSGEISTIVTHKSRYTDAAGKHFIVGVIRDITERKEWEETLKEKNIELEKQIKKSEDHRIANLVILNDLNETTVELKSEIEKHKIAEEQIKQDLREKNVLIQELFHRTKNNMQLISSLLNMESSRTDNQIIRDVFRNMVNKIRSMSLVHQHLIAAKDITNIDLGKYITDIVTHLFAGNQDPLTELSLNLDVKEVFVSIDFAVPFGLILNELINNILKHAFKDRSEGMISIKLVKDENDRIIMDLCDNGIGVPDDFNIEEVKSLGLRTTYLLIRQLKGEITHTLDKGLSWRLSFSENRFTDRLKTRS